jgi:DNA-directed RNA polymerase subunit beta
MNSTTKSSHRNVETVSSLFQSSDFETSRNREKLNSISVQQNWLENKHYFDFKFSTQIPNLIDVQREGFYNFLQFGLKTAFQNPLCFTYGIQKLEIEFFPEWIHYQKPEFTQNQAFVLGKTYGSSVYIPIAIKSNMSSKLQVEWLFVGVLPLMTQHGHFVINGIPRVVLHQMVRKPGIYSLPRDSRTQKPTVRIVPEKGGWINLTVDKKNRLWFATRSLRRKISLLVVLQALGFSLSDLFQRLEHTEILGNSYVKELSFKVEEDIPIHGKTRHDKILIRAGLTHHPSTQQESWKYIYSHFLEYYPYPRDEGVTKETARNFFWTNVWNPEKLVLGEIGRQQFQEKTASQEPLDNLCLTAEDILAATQLLLKLIYKEQPADEIDSLTQKRIRGCDDFLTEQLEIAIKDFQLFFSKKVNTLPAPKATQSEQNYLEILWRQNKSVFSKTVTKSWKRFFTSGTLSQFMDQTNPLAESTHKRRLTVLGPGGIANKQTTIQIRGIHPTYYGRFCPIETPEGQNAGLVNSFTVLSTLSKDAGPTNTTISTPFYQVYKGQIQKNLPPFLVLPQHESQNIGAPSDISLTPWNVFPKVSLPVRKELNFDSEFSTRIMTQSLGILQNISVATSLIPFLEHDDANRALMGSNMQRQAVPLLKPEAPLVGTGLETRVLSDVNHVLLASQSGYISRLWSRTIKTVTPVLSNVRKSRIRSLFQKNQTGNFRIINTFRKIENSHKKNQIQSQFLRKRFLKNFGSENNSLFDSLLKLNTQKTNKIQKSLISFLPKEQQEQEQNPKEKIYSLTHFQRTNQSTYISQRPLFSETAWVEKGDILTDGAASSRGKLSIGQNVLIAYLPWEGYNFEDAILISERLVEQDVFTSLHIDHYDIEVKNTQHGLEQITNKIPLKTDESSQEIAKIEKLNAKGLIEVGSWVKEGDYLVGKISPLNPKGPSVETQYEKLYNVIMQREKTISRNTSLRVPRGVEGFVLDVQNLPSRELDVAALAEKDAILRVRVVLLQRRRIQVGDKMAGRHGNKGIVSNILARHDMPYLPDGTPIDIVLNPLGVPSRMNVGQIFECLLGLAGRYLEESYTTHLFDEKFGAEASRSLVYSKLYEASIKTSNSWLFEPQHPGKIKLFDGRTGVPFDQPVTVGCAYMLKLVHQVDDKIHARSTGPYSAVTQQPVRGRSRNGGQRVGEMEVWALQAYGAAYTLHEILTLKSDDIEGRKQSVFRIYSNKPLTPGKPESFKVVLRELQALCFDIKPYAKQRYRLALSDKVVESFGPIPSKKLENFI